MLFTMLIKKYKTVFRFIYSDLNTRDVGRTREKRRKPRREAEWFPASQVFSQHPKCLDQSI